MTLTITALSMTDEHAFPDALAIYREAIEPSEQKTEAELRAALARADYRFLIARRAGVVVGMAVSFAPAGSDFWLFEYAAVTSGERGQGTGAALFRAAAEEEGAGRMGLVEVDAGRRGEAGWEIRVRRLGFYGRLGCRRIEGVDYILPLEVNGAPPPMVLLALAPDATTRVARGDVERWLRRIYVEVYGQAGDDPRITGMVRSLPDRARLVGIS